MFLLIEVRTTPDLLRRFGVFYFLLSVFIISVNRVMDVYFGKQD